MKDFLNLKEETWNLYENALKELTNGNLEK